ncbi:MAG: hypothetical protein JXA33_01165 [Anaerolineae bacterium]|nr:hypothetical protein [Anaerolineae bacterium]
MKHVAVFEGLVVDEFDNPLAVTYIGDVPHYVVDDAGFLRHIPSEKVDRQVLEQMQENVLANRDLVVDGMMNFMGKDDLFTKAAVETSIAQMNEHIEQLFQTGIPEDARAWLGMMGFSIVINYHGDVITINMPEAVDYDE